MATRSASRPAIDVGRVLDEGRWTGYQRWLIFLTALTIVFDGIDNQLLGIVIPSVMKEWALPRSAFALVVALGYLGMMVGGAIAGMTGDRFGRRVALLGSLAVFGTMTLAAAAVTGIPALAALRLLAGVGLGGAMPNAAALAAEFVPRRRRPLAVTVTIVCVPLGATLAGLLGIRLLPSLGWRALFVIGGLLPLVGALWLIRALPESPRYLARHAKRWPELERLLRRMGHAIETPAAFVDSTEAATARAPISALFQPDFRRDTFALWGSFFSCLLAVYLGFSWLPSLLTGAGYSPSVGSTGITSFNLGGVVGALLGGVAIARFGSRVSMLTMTAGAIAGAAVLAMMTIANGASVMAILVMLTLTGGLINAVQTTMYALAAHVYPSATRATGVGTATAIGRSGAVLSGYAGPWALADGSRSYFGMIGIAMCVTFISLALVRRHVTGRTR